MWLDVINIILLSIFISRLLIKIVAGADTAYFPNCIFAGTLGVIVKKNKNIKIMKKIVLTICLAIFGLSYLYSQTKVELVEQIKLIDREREEDGVISSETIPAISRPFLSSSKRLIAGFAEN